MTDPEDNRASQQRRESPRLPRWFGVTACAAVSMAVFGVFLWHGVAPAVIGYNLVPSERVLNGEAPYRDFLYNYTPGVLWLNAALFKLFGANLLTSRTGVLIAKAAAAVVLFLISRRFLGGWRLALPIAMTLAWVGYGDVLKVFPAQYGMAFLLASCLSMLKWRENQSRSILLSLAGASAGMVFIFKHNVGVYTIAAAALSAIDPFDVFFGTRRAVSTIRTELKKALLVFVGFAIVTGVMVAILAFQSALLPMLKHFLHHATAYGEAKGIALPHPRALAYSTIAIFAAAAVGAAVKRNASARVFEAYVMLTASAFVSIVVFSHAGVLNLLSQSFAAQAYYLPIWSTAAALVISIVTVKRRGGGTDHAGRLITMAWFSLAAFLEILPRSDADHLVRVLPPSLLLLLAVMAYPRVTEAQATSPTLRTRSLLLLAASSLIIAVGIRSTWSTQLDSISRWKENTPLAFERGSGVAGQPGEAARLNAVVDYVVSNTAPGDPIFALSRKMSGVYFLAGRENTTRLLWFDSAGVTKEEREHIYQRVQNREFKLILIGGDLTEELSVMESHDEQRDTDRARNQAADVISRGYRVVFSIEGVSILAPRI